jgi:hypothetical protein
MGSMRHRMARWGLALACVACGSVEESVTSATLGDPETSTGASAADPDSDSEPQSVSLDGATTQGSAEAEDASTDPEVTTNDVTTGTGDTGVDTGDPSTSSTTAPIDPTTDDGAGTTMEPPPSVCDPEVSDTTCDTCMKTMCCDQVEACALNAQCWCIEVCVGDGGSPWQCADDCGVDAAPPGSLELAGCANLVCGVQCPQL